MMSSLPSLSQSINPTPPLIDSTMYFLSGEEMCATVRAACWAMSSNFGSGAAGLGDCVSCEAGLRGLFGATCESEIADGSNPTEKKIVHKKDAARMGMAIIQSRAKS